MLRAAVSQVTAGLSFEVLHLCLLNYVQFALTLLVGWQEGHPASKKNEGWGVIVVIYLERCADLHMAQLMPLPLTVSCFSKIQIGFAFLVPAHLGSSGKRAVKQVYVQFGTEYSLNILISTVQFSAMCPLS